ncbi:unnamed protein product [Cuscuta campestris]|uniref:Epidermal patterning factor-like protein n=1 Tax=Cuscuta campestris TaxID=132261 RepID=A0A484MD93_9ASTE|nr:unnamed protein product [Cuscuta campestris]
MMCARPIAKQVVEVGNTAGDGGGGDKGIVVRKTAEKGGGDTSSRTEEVGGAGSRLPDCSHACGSCRPCRLVMVSFVCSSLEEAETCPMAYKCMCNNKSYPVP